MVRGCPLELPNSGDRGLQAWDGGVVARVQGAMLPQQGAFEPPLPADGLGPNVVLSQAGPTGSRAAPAPHPTLHHHLRIHSAICGDA